jgi:putative membrane-bound dehydrogenase-like protein
MKRTALYIPLSILAAAQMAFGAERIPPHAPGSGPDAAAEQLAAVQAAEGLEVSLFASEPMVVNPADMDVDSKGRVWITEGANYRVWQKWGKLRPGGDRIVVLEDTNGDGAADKETVFYQGEEINTALGICVLGNKVIVSRSPDVFVFTDENGDGVSDKKELLFTGLSGVDHDHGVHAFVFGPDGKLYFNFGNEGKQIKRPDGSPVIDRYGNEVNNKGTPYRMGMIFRCNIDGSDFEVLAHNFRNNYEVAVDSFGGLWQSDNDDDGNKGVRINFILEGGNYGYSDEVSGKGWQQKRVNWEDEVPKRHWHLNDPGVVPNLLQTGAGAPTGLLIYEGKALPERFQGQMIHCDSGARVVRAYPVTKDGAGYTAKIDNILTADDSPAGKWFRPSDVTVAPDGSLYVCDWNDAGVGGHFMADQKLETMTGRVYHVTPKGKKLQAPKISFDTAKDCVAALESPNQDTRYRAWTKLHDMQDKAESDLKKLRGNKDPRMQSRAFQLLADIKGKGQKYIDEALKDKNEDIRCAALRHLRAENMDTIPAVKKLINDPSAAVRRECALSLRRSKSPEAPGLWTQLAKQYDGKDRWYLEALGIGMDQNEDAYFDTWLTAVGDKWNSPAGRDIVWRSRSKKTPALLAKIVTDKSTPEAEKARYMRAMDFQKGPEKEAALIEMVTAGSK